MLYFNPYYLCLIKGCIFFLIRSDILKFIKQMLKLCLLVLDIFCQSLYFLLQLHSTVVFTFVFFVV